MCRKTWTFFFFDLISIFVWLFLSMCVYVSVYPFVCICLFRNESTWPHLYHYNTTLWPLMRSVTSSKPWPVNLEKEKKRFLRKRCLQESFKEFSRLRWWKTGNAILFFFSFYSFFYSLCLSFSTRLNDSIF